MMHVEPSFVPYALLLDLGCCLRVNIVLIKLVELVEPEEEKNAIGARCLARKVCSPMRSNWGTSLGEDKLGLEIEYLIQR